MECLNLVVEVVEIGPSKIVETRFGEAKTALAIVKDETGMLNLKLWRKQVDLVKPSDIIRIENGFATKYSGRTEINVGSKGQIIVIKRRQR
ncbi:MAG: DNA-binding protein [candidate division WOR-3 bacterium]